MSSNSSLIRENRSYGTVTTTQELLYSGGSPCVMTTVIETSEKYLTTNDP